MLLDRRKIRRWAKWVALVLAIIFAISFVAIGVGQGTSGANVFAALSCSNNNAASSQPKTVDEKIAAFQTALKANPKDKDALIGLANLYQGVYDSGSSTNNAPLLAEAQYLQQLIDADPTQVDVYLRLARLYMNKAVSDNKSASEVLNKAVSIAPDNADVFIQLGVAQKALGNYPAAVMAWQRYLDLAPNGDQASAIRDQIKVLSATTTTTTAASTTTTAAGSSTTVGSATTTSTATSSTATTASPTTTAAK